MDKHHPGLAAKVLPDLQGPLREHAQEFYEIVESNKQLLHDKAAVELRMERREAQLAADGSARHWPPRACSLLQPCAIGCSFR